MKRVLHLANKGFSEYFLFKGSKVLAVFGGAFLLGLMVVTFITVVFRLLPIRSDWLVGGYEFSEMFMSMLTPFAMAYAWYRAGHVRIGLVRSPGECGS
jgi:TRAP-type C4-dicarboxylate transport system permease small subunit